MRFCRFNDNRLGLVQGAQVRDVTAALEVLPATRYPLPSYDVFIAHLDALRRRAIEAIAQAAPALRSKRSPSQSGGESGQDGCGPGELRAASG